MITKEEAQRIVDKYHGSFSLLQREGTLEEKTAVLKWVANEANRKQRKLAGLE